MNIATLKAAAQAQGFTVVADTPSTLAMFSRERQEGFQIFLAPEGRLSFALWHAPERYAVVTDLRAEPVRHARGDTWLTGTPERRPAGVGQIRHKRLTARGGLPVGERELRRRIKDPQWLEKAS